MRPIVQVGLIALALAGTLPLGACVLDDMWSDNARAECDRDANAGRRLDCNDRVDRIERDRDRR